MSPQAKKELVKKNEETIARMAARREVRRLRAAKKKVPAELLAKAGFGSEAPRTRKTKAAVQEQKVAERIHESVAKTIGRKMAGLKWLREQIKAKHPEVKNMADAKSHELEVMLRANPGDSLLGELQETWAKRAKARHEAWLRGDSQSAKAFRAKHPVPGNVPGAPLKGRKPKKAVVSSAGKTAAEPQGVAA